VELSLHAGKVSLHAVEVPLHAGKVSLHAVEVSLHVGKPSRDFGGTLRGFGVHGLVWG
jgi:hypothetical protein